MPDIITVTANWETGNLSNRVISRQYDNNRYRVQFMGYPEDGTENLIFYLLIFMQTAEAPKGTMLAPIRMDSDQWTISNYFTQIAQQIRFQLCIQDEGGTYEAHSPVFNGTVLDSLEHDGEDIDIDTSALFDYYREYINELIIRSGAVVIDTALDATSENPVQNKAVAAAFTEVNGRLVDIADTGVIQISKDISWINGYVNRSGKIMSSSASMTGLVLLHAGETVTIGTRNTSICIIGSTEDDSISVGDTITVIWTTSTADQYETYTYTASEDENIVLCVRRSKYAISFEKKGELVSRISENEENIQLLTDRTNAVDAVTANVEIPIYETTTVPTTMTTGACLNTGSIRTDYSTYQYSQKIPVSEGDVVTPVSENQNAYFRYVCAYAGTVPNSSKGVTSGVTQYIVPEGIDGVVITTLIDQNVTAVNVKHISGYEEKVYLTPQKLGKVNWKGNLSDGDTVELLPSNVRFNVVWVFTGHISTMGKITIGVKTPTGIIKELCSVDSTYLYYRLSSGSIASVAHGLEISEDLHIVIDSPFKVNELGRITICSRGNEYTLTETPYGTDMNNTPYLVSSGAVMTDCAFSWIPKDIDKPIWIFGDSWVSMYDTRWPFYMVRGGFTNSWMLNGFAGEDTDEAYESLLNLLTIRKPDYIVWLLGMNNRDSSTAVNTVWKSIYDKLTALCTEYKINLILYTVPNTPTIKNTFKNEIVRESGYRYIDGVAAVGDDGAGNWFTGYEQSSTDHNHTSARGAKALFHRILTDFPEIAGNSL